MKKNYMIWADFLGLHESRDWGGLAGYISMRERPMWMKRSDWLSLRRLNPPGRFNDEFRRRRGEAFAHHKHWKAINLRRSAEATRGKFWPNWKDMR